MLYTLLALVLGGIGLAVGVSQYQDAERSTSVQATVGEVNAIIGAAKQNFGQYGYVDVTTAVAVASQVIPPVMANGNAAANKFGGVVTLEAGAGGTAQLTYTLVPRNVCLSIVNGTHSMAREITVGTQQVKTATTDVVLTTLTTACTANANSSIVWTIGRT